MLVSCFPEVKTPFPSPSFYFCSLILVLTTSPSMLISFRGMHIRNEMYGGR